MEDIAQINIVSSICTQWYIGTCPSIRGQSDCCRTFYGTRANRCYVHLSHAGRVNIHVQEIHCRGVNITTSPAVPTGEVEVLRIEHLVIGRNLQPLMLCGFTPTTGMNTGDHTCHCIGKYRKYILGIEVRNNRCRNELGSCIQCDRRSSIVCIVVCNHTEVICRTGCKVADRNSCWRSGSSCTGSEYLFAVLDCEIHGTAVIRSLRSNLDGVEAHFRNRCSKGSRSLRIYDSRFTIEICVSYPESQIIRLIYLHLVDISPVGNSSVISHINVYTIPLLTGQALGYSLFCATPNRHETNRCIICNPNIIVQFLHHQTVEAETYHTEIAVII